MSSTFWAALGKGVIGPVVVFVLFGAAWFVGRAVWRHWPEGKARRWMLSRVDQSGKTVTLVIVCLLLFVSALVVIPEL